MNATPSGSPSTRVLQFLAGLDDADLDEVVSGADRIARACRDCEATLLMNLWAAVLVEAVWVQHNRATLDDQAFDHVLLDGTRPQGEPLIAEPPWSTHGGILQSLPDGTMRVVAVDVDLDGAD